MTGEANVAIDQPRPLPRQLRLGETLEVFTDGTQVNLQVKSEANYDEVLHNFHLAPMEAKEVMVALGITVAEAECNQWDHYDAGDAPTPGVLLDLGAGQ
jgi:hypothetical protein